MAEPRELSDEDIEIIRQLRQERAEASIAGKTPQREANARQRLQDFVQQEEAQRLANEERIVADGKAAEAIARPKLQAAIKAGRTERRLKAIGAWKIKRQFRARLLRQEFSK